MDWKGHTCQAIRGQLVEYCSCLLLELICIWCVGRFWYFELWANGLSSWSNWHKFSRSRSQEKRIFHSVKLEDKVIIFTTNMSSYSTSRLANQSVSWALVYTLYIHVIHVYTYVSYCCYFVISNQDLHVNWTELHEKLYEEVLVPLTAYQSQFPDIKVRHSKTSFPPKFPQIITWRHSLYLVFAAQPQILSVFLRDSILEIPSDSKWKLRFE